MADVGIYCPEEISPIAVGCEGCALHQQMTVSGLIPRAVHNNDVTRFDSRIEKMLLAEEGSVDLGPSVSVNAPVEM